MSGYGYYGYDSSGYGGGAYSTAPGAYGYHHGLTYAGESYYSSQSYRSSTTVNAGYETYAGGKSYYAATFDSNGVFTDFSYRISASNGSYSSIATYVYHAAPPSYGFSYYGYTPFQSEQTTQTSTYEQQGSVSYLHIVDTSADSYFNGAYHNSYSAIDRTMDNGGYVSGSFYKMSSYTDGYGYTSYATYQG